ncbi:hypothetical protein EI42_03376 [Thermosporothrix hazakensis]|jgi:hypothetical protein|uniref:Uncharacterized protein n=2 Tax=Thermosporothrix TaxID=768650 RepID=A0A326U4M2_THEHA|nr:hypothetical protein [Thermosporothrix hazakensis]PZW27998.1 hypothetical protein EI42_03376 [Thermosporothrix hazakensis]BBH86930.1 hypothetical protein KTC_16810 [Thermosporothrix sp. COM3]GCE51221.1 hypothetical protein KTH_60900 [Thermosporothrix hazakensis]
MERSVSRGVAWIGYCASVWALLFCISIELREALSGFCRGSQFNRRGAYY